MSRRAVMISGSVGAVILTVLVTAFAVAAARGDQVVSGVTLEGIELGGMTADEVRAEVMLLEAARSTDGVTFTADGADHLIDPSTVGVTVDVEAELAEVMAAGRTGGFFGDRRAALFGSAATLSLRVEVDEEALAARIAEIARDVDADVDAGGVTIDPVTLVVTGHGPVTGVTTHQDEAAALAIAAFMEAGADTIDLPVDVTAPETDFADVADVVAAAEDAVSDDLRLSSDDGEVVLSPREIAPVLVTEQRGTGAAATLVLVVDPAAVEETLLDVLAPLTVDPQNAAYDAPAVPSVGFDDKDDATWRPVPAEVLVIPSRTGTAIDPEITADQLTGALADGDRRIVLRLVELAPEFTTAQAQDAGIDTLLSTFTTYHACCATRVHNIQRLADLVDGTVVLAGDQFSINQISGVRECSKGFREAGMIQNGEIVDSCGGGVSQFGTTTVNAVFFAGLKADAYKPHSFYISRYPMAREATLNYPSPDIDVKFTNDTGHPILVRTSHTGTSITVTFYGHSDVTEVRADVGTPTNTKPFKTIRRVNSGLPPGAQTRIQGGQNGFSVKLTRYVVRGGSESSDDWSNTYVPETEIYEYNPAKKPAPKPTPTPDPAPTEEPEPGDGT